MGSARLSPLRCSCGKIDFGSREAAADVVARAKIARYLRHNGKRREERFYPCPHSSGAWHVTSQHERDQGPTYDPGDDEAAREYLETVVVSGDARHRGELLSDRYLDQTVRVLGDLNTALHDTLRETADRRPVQQVIQALSVWRSAAAGAEKARNVEATSGQIAREKAYLTRMVRELVLSVHEHREAKGGSGDPADRRLWDLLATVHMPRGDEPVASLIASGAWWRGDDEPDLIGEL